MTSFFIKNKIKIYCVFLFFFSILINQYYGYVGLNPIDSFFSFNAGYDILNGKYPFKDYWTITGPFIAATQALFFKIFGVTWSSYIFHASIFNFIFTILTFFVFYKLKLDINFCFLYALLLSMLAYPSSGTPYVDHHASYLSVIAIFIFILALDTKLNIYWFVLPIVLGISFLSKQAPTGHIFLITIFLSLFYFIFNFNTKNFIYGIFGSITFISIFLFILFIGNIPLLSFLEQYILFPLSLGESRLEFLFPIEFKRIILRFKLIHISYLLMLIILIKEILNNISFVKKKDFYILLSLIGLSFALIFHQLMTINGLYIYFLIPILSGFSHIFYAKYYKSKNYILYFLLTLSIISTGYYSYKYVHKRDFMDLRNINKENSINAKILSNKLNGLKWITILYPDKPNKEIENLLNSINIIKNDKKSKMIVTDYQFISVINSEYDNSPSQVWFNYHVNPIKGSKYYEIYRDFVISRMKENNIEIIYVIKPLWGGNEIIDQVLSDDCFIRNKLSQMLETYLIKKCSKLKY